MSRRGKGRGRSKVRGCRGKARRRGVGEGRRARLCLRRGQQRLRPPRPGLLARRLLLHLHRTMHFLEGQLGGLPQLTRRRLERVGLWRKWGIKPRSERCAAAPAAIRFPVPWLSWPRPRCAGLLRWLLMLRTWSSSPDEPGCTSGSHTPTCIAQPSASVRQRGQQRCLRCVAMVAPLVPALYPVIGTTLAIVQPWQRNATSDALIKTFVSSKF